jgi:hypothetical protein
VTFEQIYETLPGNGWLSKVEARLLHSYAMPASGAILEVGCYQGRSTVLLASLGRQVYAIDPFSGFDEDDADGEKAHNAFWNNLLHRGLLNVVLFRCKVEAWSPRPVGFAYLDGDHTYKGTVQQIRIALACKPKCIAIHDVNDTGDGANIKQAALQLLGPWTVRHERLAVWQLLH